MTETGQDLDLVFGALADGNRRKILTALKSGPQTISTLAEPIGISTWGVMKHVQVLETCGLVESEKRGRSRYCRLRIKQLEIACSWIQDMQGFWGQNLERLAIHLQEK